MTNLELILIGIIWIAYGVYAISTLKDEDGDTPAQCINDSEANVGGAALFVCFMMIAFSPVVFFYRALVGIFKTYKW